MATELGGFQDRSAPPIVAGVDDRASQEQGRDDPRILTPCRGFMQGRVSVLAAVVDRASGVEQKPHRFQPGSWAV